jgi:hypothetical protein
VVVVSDFKQQLAKQLRFLESSCRGFDAGDHDESIRIAAAVRVIFHNTGNSTSLLRHLGDPPISIVSTCPPPPTNPNIIQVRMDGGLTVLHVSATGAEYRVALGDALFKYFMACPDWWQQTLLTADGVNTTRKELVLGATNKDGGAHVDPNITKEYALAAARTWIGQVGGRTVFIKNDPHLVALRQLGYEVLASPDLIALSK